MSEGYKINDQSKIHFVTFTVVDWVDIFTRQIYKDIVIDSFKYCQKEKGMDLYGYVIMSNHIHLILQSQKGSLSDLIRDMKKYIAKTILEAIENTNESRKDWMLKRFEFAAKGTNANEIYKFWQSGNHPEEIYSESFFWTKLNYIHMNPVKAGFVRKASDYIYCSASNYFLNDGIIDIIMLTPPMQTIDGVRFKINDELW
jgi:REP element-mobilizing transposase RayT